MPSNTERAGQADCLANSGARGTLLGPEQFCGVQTRRINRLVSQWAKKKLDCSSKKCVDQRQSKSFIKSSGKLYKLLELRRSVRRLDTEFYTGHNSLRYQLKNMGMSERDSVKQRGRHFIILYVNVRPSASN